LAAIAVLAEIPAADAGSLACFLIDPEPEIRQRVAQALHRRHALGPECATRLLGDEDGDVRWLATASVRGDLAGALPALKHAAHHFGAPLHGWAPRFRPWWQAWILIAAPRVAPSGSSSVRCSVIDLPCA
jgi:hypothetical protein